MSETLTAQDIHATAVVEHPLSTGYFSGGPGERGHRLAQSCVSCSLCLPVFFFSLHCCFLVSFDLFEPQSEVYLWEERREVMLGGEVGVELLSVPGSELGTGVDLPQPRRTYRVPSSR